MKSELRNNHQGFKFKEEGNVIRTKTSTKGILQENGHICAGMQAQYLSVLWSVQIMTYPEYKKPVLTDKGIENKAPEHRRNALKDKYQETLRSPITPAKEIKILTLDLLLEINEKIKLRAERDSRIEYRGSEDYPIKVQKLKKLVDSVPGRDVLEIAAYYLKNIILLQAFPDANHRTALTATKIFLEMNSYEFSYTPDEAYKFQTDCYNKRMQIYKTYEEMPTGILKEEDNNLFSLCLEFVKTHLSFTSTS